MLSFYCSDLITLAGKFEKLPTNSYLEWWKSKEYVYSCCYICIKKLSDSKLSLNYAGFLIFYGAALCFTQC